MRQGALLLLSHDGPPSEEFARAIASGALSVKRQVDLAPDDLDGIRGLITTMYLDQIDFLTRRETIRHFLGNGGRLVFNGHVARPFIDGLCDFVPLANQRRVDLALTRLHPHPVFAGIATEQLATHRGVAGFYGRGHNPPLGGGTPLIGIGPACLPIDWEWLSPSGGGVFVHSGNDIWGNSDEASVNLLIAARLVAWSSTGGTRTSAE